MGNYQAGEWGPVAEHTDLRFYGLTVNDNSGNHGSWLWEATSEHCNGCEPHGLGYPGEDYWGQAGYIAHDDSAFYGGVYDFEDGTCINVSGFTDTEGDGCDWYEGR